MAGLLNAARRFAVEMALKMRLSQDVSLDNLPTVIADGLGPVSARTAKEDFLGFVQRYKGPTGREPEVQGHELFVAATPSWITSLDSQQFRGGQATAAN